MTSLLKADRVCRDFYLGADLFGKNKRVVQAVKNISFEVTKGQTLGIVGESGCGKSTLARMLVGLDRPTSGSIKIAGEDVMSIHRRGQKVLAQKIQYVFQDPNSSLNPRKTIARSLEVPLKLLRGLSRKDINREMAMLMETVNLRPEFLQRYPHEFSGGQAQRIGIARALAARPEIIVLDEPVSALDVSIQAQVLNLLDELKSRFDLTYVFISHDLAVVESICDKLAVMYFGSFAEGGQADRIFSHAAHPYTELLLSSAPVPGKKGITGEQKVTELPDPLSPPAGCAFAPRCQYQREKCTVDHPPYEPLGNTSQNVSCHFPLASREQVNS